jgi:NAD+ synthase
VAAAAALSRLTGCDYGRISRVIQDFISSYVSSASAKGVVLGLSGGLDSSVAAKLCVLALGKDGVFGLVMPAKATPDKDLKDAIALAKRLGIKYGTIDIQPIIDKFMRSLPPADKKAQGNLAARVRMSILYHHAFIKQHLVVGTSDKSEFYIGYFSKFGDGGSDLAPIADLYKTQVRALGKFLDVPPSILKKKSSPQLWKGHLAEKELGIDYETLDPILHLLVDKKVVAAIDVARELGISIETVERVQEMINKSAHKRRLAKICYIS